MNIIRALVTIQGQVTFYFWPFELKVWQENLISAMLYSHTRVVFTNLPLHNSLEQRDSIIY